MEEIETSKLNRNLASVLERIAQGESFHLTRYGKVVAVLSPHRQPVIKKAPPIDVGDEDAEVVERIRPKFPAHAKYDTPAGRDLLNKMNKPK